MNHQLKNLVRRSAAGALALSGLLLVVFGYIQLRDQDDIVLQLPYLASCGLGGIALIGVGAMVLIQQQMREQSARAAAINESLEEWKESALAELRLFLTTATLELEVRDLTPGGHRRENVPSSVAVR